MLNLFIVLLFQFQAQVPDSSPVRNTESIFSDLADMIRIIENDSILHTNSGLSSAAINGMLQSLDPHSSYYNQPAFEEVMASQGGSFSGVGIRVLRNRSQLFISEVKKGSPAESAGLRWGDQILQVNGVKTTEENMGDLINQIRGPRGTQVKFTIRSYLKRTPRNLTISREEIANTSLSQAFFLPGLSSDVQTGYVKLDEFGETSGTELQTAIEDMVLKGLDYLILDLRDNPGGLLPQAIKVAGLFLPPKSLVVRTQSRYSSESRNYYSEDVPPVFQGPLTLLIDRGTASAAEIVAGALQDYDRAIILGSQSWGKGLVQSVFAIPPGETGLALTTARYFSPLGRNIQGKYNEIYKYLQPDSGEDFYFRPKGPGDHFVTTPAGRKLFFLRGICPDVFFLNRKKTMGVQLASLNQSMPFFFLDQPHLSAMDFFSFMDNFRIFFSLHNGYSLPLQSDQDEAIFLYYEYIAFLENHVLNNPASCSQLLLDPIIPVALGLGKQAFQMSLTCFKHQPMPPTTLQSLLDISQSFRLTKGILN